MSDRKPRERTFGGLAGKLVGRAKEALASATGNDRLAPPEGRPQEQARADVSGRQAAVEAERERLGSEINAAQREHRIERDRVQSGAQAASPAADQRASVDPGTRARRTGAERSVLAAEQVRLAATEEANRLEREAREAERRRAP